MAIESWWILIKYTNNETIIYKNKSKVYVYAE